jgi:hypothetical protein
MAKIWMDFDVWADINDSWDGKSVEELSKEMSQKRKLEALESTYQGGKPGRGRGKNKKT